MKSIESKLKSNWNQFKVNWNQIESKLKSNWNQLKVNWNQLKSIENQTEIKLKSIQNQLKVNWNYDPTNYSEPLTSKFTSLKSTPQMFEGASRH